MSVAQASWSWSAFFLTYIGLWIIISVRYFAMAGFFHWLLWRKNSKFKVLSEHRPNPKLMASERRWSLASSFIFAVPGAVMIEAWKNGGTLIYSVLNQYGLIYLPVSAFLFLFLHDTYFYWLHRWLHRPQIYPTFHRVHHQSLNPTSWAAFSFHPYESIFEALILPLLTFVIPIHVGVLLGLLTLMTLTSVTNHAGVEIFPELWIKGFWGRWVITATHHDRHHKKFNCNYGLYFRFWDRWMKTDELIFETGEKPRLRPRDIPEFRTKISPPPTSL